jgi:hypothetical protein
MAIGVHALLAASVGTLAPAFLALVSLVAPPHVRAATFSTISVAAVPGIAVFLPILGAVSDAVGLQARLLLVVPTCIAAALMLASATGFVDDDIAHMRLGSLPPPDTRPDVRPARGEGAATVA